ncbi:MAG: hypothetical protein L7U87_05455 [Chlamydiales bacterium]|nr:hypothetical protein [Chlamydiales bacterium]
MDLFLEKQKLENLILAYLDGKTSVEELNEFAWTVIETFSLINKTAQPPEKEWEGMFWYAIWQLQHIADAEHESDGTTQRDLKVSLAYLKNEIPFPSTLRGRRP